MKRLYVYQSPAGDFYICRIGRYYLAYFGSRLLGSFSTAEEAARDVAVGRSLAMPPGFEFDELQIPADLAGWKEIE